MKREELIDITATRPGTPGGRFMRQFWIAVQRSEDLPSGHAKPIRIMSEDYTLYRGEARGGAGRLAAVIRSRRPAAQPCVQRGRQTASCGCYKRSILRT